MWWWTTVFAVPTTASSTAEEVFKERRPNSGQGGQPGVQGRLAMRCKVIGLFVQHRAKWLWFWTADGGTLRAGLLQNLWLGPEPHSVLDEGLSVCPSVALSPSVLVCPLRHSNEMGLCNRMFAARGMKSFRVDEPWCEGILGSSSAKSKVRQRSFLRDGIVGGRSSRDVSESLRRRVYLVRFSIPGKGKREGVKIRSCTTVIFIILNMSVWLQNRWATW